MYKVGITGGIGTGKSTVCKVFESLNIPVLYADDVAKSVMVNNLTLRAQLIELFGPEAYDKHNLNRSFIANIVFNDEEKLLKLNALVHPATLEAFENWCSAQQSPYVLKEAALMFESGANLYNNFNIIISSPLELRIARVMERDACTQEEVLARMNRQWPEVKKTSLCDAVIVNDGTQSIIEQVLSLHKTILANAGY